MNPRLFIFIALFLIQLYGCGSRFTKQVCISDTCVMAEIADSPKERERGLMFRRGLGDNQGMLFIYADEKRYSIWMKNMRFPLDIIWLDRNKRVSYIYEYAIPCRDICKTMHPDSAAQFILEVNAGFVKKHKIKIGDTAVF